MPFGGGFDKKKLACRNTPVCAWVRTDRLLRGTGGAGRLLDGRTWDDMLGVLEMKRFKGIYFGSYYGEYKIVYIRTVIARSHTRV